MKVVRLNKIYSKPLRNDKPWKKTRNPFCVRAIQQFVTACKIMYLTHMNSDYLETKKL
jgi:hypothetical protein